MAPPRLPKRITDLASLAPPFRPVAEKIVADVIAEDLPMVVRETLRSLELQAYYAKKGWSDATGISAPHCWGLAMDMVLAVKDDRWAKIGERPIKAIDGGGPEWDQGWELLPDGPVCVRPKLDAIWRRYGEIVRAAGAEWGGDWSRKIPEPFPFGWDAPHGQHAQFQNRKTRGALLAGLPPPT